MSRTTVFASSLSTATGCRRTRTRATTISARISITSARRSRNGSGRSAVNRRRARGRVGRGELVAGLAVEQHEPAVGVAQRHAVRVQAAVERVVEDGDAVARAAFAQLELIPQWSDSGSMTGVEVYSRGHGGFSAPDLLIGRPRRPTMRGQRG